MSIVDQKVTITSNIVNDEDVLRAKIGDEAYDKKYGSLRAQRFTTPLYQDSASGMGCRTSSCGV